MLKSSSITKQALNWRKKTLEYLTHNGLLNLYKLFLKIINVKLLGDNDINGPIKKAKNVMCVNGTAFEKRAI